MAAARATYRPSFAVMPCAFTLVSVFMSLCQAAPEYIGVCDAGSTGTRLYIFKLDVEQAKASSVFVKKTKPGLSSYANDPQAAVAPLLKLFGEGAQKVPEDARAGMSLAIFGTAGMRMLLAEKQAEIWKAVASGLRSSDDFPFAPGKLEARTVSGNEEGLWAVLATNFLNGRMSHELLSLGKDSPLGLMDLGGSSTQIALPAAETAKPGSDFTAGVTVQSYLGFGMTYIQKELRDAHAGGTKDAVCYMQGAPIDGALVGTGDSGSCRELIHGMFKEKIAACEAAKELEICLGDLKKMPDKYSAIKKEEMNFFAVSGFTYVVDFVRWRLQMAIEAKEIQSSATLNTVEGFLKAFPTPTLSELEGAVDALCHMEYSFVADLTADASRRHPFTEKDNAPYRCFQANYITVLLREIYGFPVDGRSVTFALEAAGEDLEWPLGALLHQRKGKATKKSEL